MTLSNQSYKDAIHVNNIRIWAHVGVFESERIYGQWFDIDFSIWLDLDKASKEDKIEFSEDYSYGIKAIHELSMKARCLTVECFSDHILNALETLYGPLPMRVILRKCKVPVDGFSGTISVEKYRNWIV